MDQGNTFILPLQVAQNTGANANKWTLFVNNTAFDVDGWHESPKILGSFQGITNIWGDDQAFNFSASDGTFEEVSLMSPPISPCFLFVWINNGNFFTVINNPATVAQRRSTPQLVFTYDGHSFNEVQLNDARLTGRTLIDSLISRSTITNDVILTDGIRQVRLTIDGLLKAGAAVLL
jgi:hypothetical protein